MMDIDNNSNSDVLKVVARPEVLLNKRGSNLKNPVISAMLSSNMMDDCIQVKDMLNHCMISQSDSVICSTAERYANLCFGKMQD